MIDDRDNRVNCHFLINSLPFDSNDKLKEGEIVKKWPNKDENTRVVRLSGHYTGYPEVLYILNVGVLKKHTSAFFFIQL